MLAALFLPLAFGGGEKFVQADDALQAHARRDVLPASQCTVLADKIKTIVAHFRKDDILVAAPFDAPTAKRFECVDDSLLKCLLCHVTPLSFRYSAGSSPGEFSRSAQAN